MGESLYFDHWKLRVFQKFSFFSNKENFVAYHLALFKLILLGVETKFKVIETCFFFVKVHLINEHLFIKYFAHMLCK